MKSKWPTSGQPIFAFSRCLTSTEEVFSQKAVRCALKMANLNFISAAVRTGQGMWSHDEKRSMRDSFFIKRQRESSGISRGESRVRNLAWRTLVGNSLWTPLICRSSLVNPKILLRSSYISPAHLLLSELTMTCWSRKWTSYLDQVKSKLFLPSREGESVSCCWPS